MTKKEEGRQVCWLAMRAYDDSLMFVEEVEILRVGISE